jgi:DtxR family Mn-dependent transcriptional regulator
VLAETLPEFIQNRATFLLMSQEELIYFDDGNIKLTPHGEQRALEIIRRHRLAERLFFDTFGLEEALLDVNACKIEHTLGPEVTIKICTFLGHPLTCPHGSPIPPGDCCPPRR